MPDDSLAVLRCVLISIGVTIVLRGFYSASRSRWPENYFGADGSVDPVVSRSVLRYAVFRLGPVAVALAAAGATAARLGDSRIPAIATSAIVYVVQGPVRALTRDWRALPRRLGLVVFRAASALGCLVVAVLIGTLGGRVDRFVPDGDEFVSAAWTAVVILALAEIARSAVAPRVSLDRKVLTARARAEVDPELLRRLRNHAAGGRAAAFEAVALAEQLNRPGWVRRLERSLLPRDASYGLMQMKAPRPIGDSRSVELFLAWTDGLPADIWPNEPWDAPRDFFLAHNPDARFADLATTLFWAISEELLATDSLGEAESTPVAADEGIDSRVRRLPDVQATVLIAGGAIMGAGLSMALGRRGARRRSF